MGRRHAAWLLTELPQLEREGVVDAASAARLRAHYAEAAQDGGLARGLSAVVGTLLVGLGIILLVAHNWDQWPRALRLTVAAMPLLCGQLACLYTVSRRRESGTWRESSAVFTLLAFAAALALVGQILHLPGDLDRYLLSCALAGLPLIYLLDASLVAVLVAGALSGWVGAQADWARQPLLVAMLFAALLPHLLRVRRQNPEALRAQLLLGTLPPLLLLALTLAMPSARVFGWAWFAGCAVLLLLADAELAVHHPNGRRPLRRYGQLGWAVIVLAASVPAFWRDRDWWRGDGAEHAVLQALIVVGALAFAAALLTIRALRRREWLLLAMALPALLIGVLHAALLRQYAAPLVIAVNVYVLAIGIAMIRDGLHTRALGRVSTGLTLLAALVLLRFFGSEWPFVVRGAVFVIVGAGFLFANVWLRRRWQRETAR